MPLTISMSKFNKLDKNITNFPSTLHDLLNNLYKEIYDTLDTLELKNKFSSILLDFNYFARAEYDEFNFKFLNFKRYKVDSSFPALRRKSLPSAIINSKYKKHLILLL